MQGLKKALQRGVGKSYKYQVKSHKSREITVLLHRES